MHNMGQVTNDKLVSIIIPTYKGNSFLGRAVSSALLQTYSNVEVIVVDDNNPETMERFETERVMDSFKDNTKVKYIKHERNRNGSAARNTGVRFSHGEYVAFLDDDDEYMPSKIESMVSKMETLSMVWGAAYSNYDVIRPNGQKLHYGEAKEGALLKDALMRNLMIAAGSNLLVRKSVFSELNGFDESFKRNQDLEFLVRLLQKHRLAYVKDLGLIVHQQNKVSSTDFIELTNQYLKTFGDFIKAFPDGDQEKIKNNIYLQVLRYELFSKKSIIGAYKVLKNYNIPLFLAGRYLFHLMDRYLTRSVRGFDL